MIFRKKSILLERIIEKIIEIEKPEVIFIREQSGVNSLFWDTFRKDCLVVSRMECNVPKYWSPVCYDLVYTNIDTYKAFFESNRVLTKTNYSGFDERILGEIDSTVKKHDVVFVGGLGSPTFNEKTDFLESLLQKQGTMFSFKWWGYKENSNFDKVYPELAKTYQGLTGGLEMFQIYKSAKIVLNDYGIIAGGQGMNQRIYEVMGVGSLLLTRDSKMFDGWEDSIVTFKNEDDCLEKIKFYLNNEDARAEKAKQGQSFVLKNHSYKDIMKKLSLELSEAYNFKFRK